MSKCLPRYPVEALASGQQGLAVIDLYLEPDGHARSLSILQAPSESIRREAKRCVSQFRAATYGTKHSLRHSKLYFYFVLGQHGGDVFVLNDLAQWSRLADIRRSVGSAWMR
jgi:hypothetical protein